MSTPSEPSSSPHPTPAAPAHPGWPAAPYGPGQGPAPVPGQGPAPSGSIALGVTSVVLAGVTPLIGLLSTFVTVGMIRAIGGAGMGGGLPSVAFALLTGLLALGAIAAGAIGVARPGRGRVLSAIGLGGGAHALLVLAVGSVSPLLYQLI